MLIALSSRNLQYNSTKDLTGYSIGVMRGAVNSTELDNSEKLNFSYSNDASQNLKKLLLNRVDYMVTGEAHLTYIINKEYGGKTPELTIFKPPLKTNDIYITLSKKLNNSKRIMQDFNRGMEIIKLNGTYQAIKEEYLQAALESR